jgi:hypothetical protein
MGKGFVSDLRSDREDARTRSEPTLLAWEIVSQSYPRKIQNGLVKWKGLSDREGY